jgi:hypothetical protein
MHELTRRDLILSLLGLAAGGVLGVRDLRGETRCPAALVAVLRDRASAIALGREYLAGRPEEADLARLARALETALALPAGDPSPAELRERLAARVRADFEQEEIVVVGGWWLSRTEARVAALAALDSDRA